VNYSSQNTETGNSLTKLDIQP